MYIIIFQRLLLEALADLFYFPLWWYTGGLKRTALGCFALFNDGNRTLAPGLWLANLFVPMFGQYDWQGRIISFFMRLVQVIFRTIALLFWFVVCLFLLALWFVWPVILIWGLINVSK